MNNEIAPLSPSDAKIIWLRKCAAFLKSKYFKVKVKDLTPELIALADDYLDHTGYLEVLGDYRDEWLLQASQHFHNWQEDRMLFTVRLDHLRVGALNHLRRYWCEETDRARLEAASREFRLIAT